MSHHNNIPDANSRSGQREYPQTDPRPSPEPWPQSPPPQQPPPKGHSRDPYSSPTQQPAIEGQYGSHRAQHERSTHDWRSQPASYSSPHQMATNYPYAQHATVANTTPHASARVQPYQYRSDSVMERETSRPDTNAYQHGQAEGNQAGHTGTASEWSGWIWNAQNQRHYRQRYNAQGQIEYYWAQNS